MARHRALISLYFLVFFISATSSLSKATDDERKVHIIYMGSLPGGEYSPLSHHFSILKSVIKDSSAEESHIVSYKRSFNGFAANITERERQQISSMKDVVSVFPSKVFYTKTTRSWDFMGFPETVTRSQTVESDTIIAVIDNGIWPESESFSDEGFGPPPKKWNGVCYGGPNFICNNKIIGARFYVTAEISSARDMEGHGTLTSSIAAGNAVKQASFYGLAEGTARGAVPSARIATYKVCYTIVCDSHAILAAMDDAIADGADIITISIGGRSPAQFLEDPIAIGGFHAMKRGILTLQPAGNEGTEASKNVMSVAPWLMTTAGSRMDRHIINKAVLRNGVTIIGNTINSFTLNGTTFPLAYGKKVSRPECNDWQAGTCTSECLDSDLVNGKILICSFPEFMDVAIEAGAIGVIVPPYHSGYDYSSVVPFASVSLDQDDFDKVLKYENTTNEPGAAILRSELVKLSKAPSVASFSSIGPNLVAPDILKPDITAPAVEILAAYTLGSPPSDSDNDMRRVKYNIESGTSFACPHVAGAAAYVKSFHPDWSPSAIKSALMTTALDMNQTDDSNLREFGYGSGHLDPIKATNPGLVYEIFEEDYVRFLCSVGYNKTILRLISGDNSSCPEGPLRMVPRNLNYPSMCARVPDNATFEVRFNRRVKNVGISNSTYKSEIVPKNHMLDVEVEPAILSFESLNEVKSFDVVVKGDFPGNNSMESVSLVWSDGTHNVRSPIVIHHLQNSLPPPK